MLTHLIVFVPGNFSNLIDLFLNFLFLSVSYRQGPSCSNLASKCPPRSSLVTRKTSPPCLQRNTSDSCKDGKGKRGRSFKENTNRIEIYLVTKLTSPPCLQRNTSVSCKDGKGKRGDPSKKIQIELKYIWSPGRHRRHACRETQVILAEFRDGKGKKCDPSNKVQIELI